MAQALAGVILAFVYGWKLTLVMISLSPLLVVGSALQFKFMSQGAQSQQGIKASSMALATDTISGIKTVVSFVWEEEAKRRFDIVVDDFYVQGKRKSHMGGFAFGLSFSLIFFVYALAFWYGGTLVGNGELVRQISSFFLTTNYFKFNFHSFFFSVRFSF